MFTLNEAIELATEAHSGQTRNNGVPYITHPLAVMDMMHTEEEQIVAILHDVIEDSSWELATYTSNGIKFHMLDIPSEERMKIITESIYNALGLLTKTPGLTYELYIQNIATNPLATKIKLGDIFHNISDSPSDKQLAKYQKVLPILLKSL